MEWFGHATGTSITSLCRHKEVQELVAIDRTVVDQWQHSSAHTSTSEGALSMLKKVPHKTTDSNRILQHEEC